MKRNLIFTLLIIPFILISCDSKEKKEPKQNENKETSYQPFGICDCLTGKLTSEECQEISIKMQEAKVGLNKDDLKLLEDNINAEAEACNIERVPLSLTQCINIHNEMNMMLKEVDSNNFAKINEIKTLYNKAIKECESLYKEEYEIHINDINETK